MSGTYGSVTRTSNDFQCCAQEEYARTSKHKENMKSRAPTAHIIVNGIKMVQPIFITKRWIVDPMDLATYKD